MALLEIENLVIRYGKALALEGVSLKVEAGELVGVLVRTAQQDYAAQGDARAVPAQGRLDFEGVSLLPFRADQSSAAESATAPRVGGCSRALGAEESDARRLPAR